MCPACRDHPHGATAQEHRAINRLLAVADERLRRLLAGLLAKQMGRGGIARLTEISGLDRNTVARGQRELRQGRPASGARIRRVGGGRKRLEDKRPGS
jgi:hypothetical protein